MPNSLKFDAHSINDLENGLGLGDTKDCLEGIRKMYIGYLLNASEDDGPEGDVKAAYNNTCYILEDRIKALKDTE